MVAAFRKVAMTGGGTGEGVATLLQLLIRSKPNRDTVASPILYFESTPQHPHLHPQLSSGVTPFGPSATSVPMRHPPPVDPPPHGSIHSSRAPRQASPQKLAFPKVSNSHRITTNRMLRTDTLERNGAVVLLGGCLPRGPHPAAIPSARGVAAHVLRVAVGSAGRSLASLSAEEDASGGARSKWPGAGGLGGRVGAVLVGGLGGFFVWFNRVLLYFMCAFRGTMGL